MSISDYDVRVLWWEKNPEVKGPAVVRLADGKTVIGPLTERGRIELLDRPNGTVAHVYMQPSYRMVFRLDGPSVLPGHSYAYVGQEDVADISALLVWNYKAAGDVAPWDYDGGSEDFARFISVTGWTKPVQENLAEFESAFQTWYHKEYGE